MRYVGQRAWGAVIAAAFIAGAGCGFGMYDDTASPEVTSASDGVADAGQWWPFVCPDGLYPIPASTPRSYLAAGSCGAGGPFALSVDGCEMFGNWSVLGLSDVQTLQPSSTPGLGAWSVLAEGAFEDGGVDAGEPWTCDTAPVADGGLSFTCSTGTPPETTCESTLTPVFGS